MDIQRINLHTSAFNEITHYIESDNGKEKVEIWFARELQSVLGYARQENFTIAIGRAVESCKSQNINVDDHFREVTKMVTLGSGAQREIQDYMLTFLWFTFSLSGNTLSQVSFSHLFICSFEFVQAAKVITASIKNKKFLHLLIFIFDQLKICCKVTAFF